MKTFYSIGRGPAIDEQKGVIAGVSLIKAGDAEGHFDKKGRQETVDETTLRQVFNYCVKAGSVKVKADHGSGVMATIGWLENFSLTDEKVVGDFHIYETEPQKPRIFEIARKNPDHMGMSLEFEGEDEAKGEKSFSRCERVLAVALVSDPAANKSLFSAIPPEPKAETTDTTKMEDDKTPATEPDKFEELSKKFDALNDQLTALSKKFETTEDKPDEEAPDAPDAPPADAPEPDADDEDKKFAKVAELAAERAIKAYAAKVGITALGKAGPAVTTTPTAKHFEEFVAELAVKEFGSDSVKARAAILTNKSKHPDAWKAYEASRLVKTS